MWHLLLSPFYMATIILCLQWAASSHVNGTELGDLALAACLGLPLTKDKMAGGPEPGPARTTSLALTPQRYRAEASPAQRGGHEITMNSPGFGAEAPGTREVKGGPAAAFIMEENTRLQRKTCQAEQGATVPLDECCFWDDIVWGFSHHVFSCLTHNLDLFYHSLILPLCKVTSVLVTMITSIQLLARCTRKSKEQSKEGWSRSSPSIVWRAVDCPDCAICLQVYEPGEALKFLSCSHVYHSKCIDLWHQAQHGSKTCPLCRRGVTTVALIHLGARNSEQE